MAAEPNPPVKESWASGYLRRRKERNEEAESQKANDSSIFGVFAAKPLGAKEDPVTRIPQPPPPVEIQVNKRLY
jgi:hypothetical protein